LIIESSVKGEVKSNFTGQTVDMKLDLSGTSHLMEVLTNMYGDPLEASIREYAANAWDAHKEVGQTRPIEIDLPTPLNPTLSIRDYGVGLSLEGLTEVYGTYGASTKRDSNEFVGGLGLGSKSALAYTNSFTVVGIKDGMKSSVQFYRDATSAGKINIIAHKETDEPNGVTVQIPCSEQDLEERYVKKLFGHWEPGSVLVNGSDPSTKTEYLETFAMGDLSFGLRQYDGNRFDYYGQRKSHMKILMGTVAYPYPSDDYTMDTYGINATDIFIRIPIGAADVSSSRDSLVLNDKLRNALMDAKISTKKTSVNEAMLDHFKAQILAASDKKEAIRLFKFYNTHISFKMKYQGKILEITAFTPKNRYDITTGRSIGYSRWYSADESDFVVVDADPAKWKVANGRRRDKVIKYMSDNHPDKTYFTIMDGGVDNLLLEESVTIVDSKDIDAVTLPKDKQTTKKRTYAGIYNVNVYEYGEFKYNLQTMTLQALIDEPKKTKFFYKEAVDNVKRDVGSLLPNDRVIVLNIPKHRIAKFEREFDTSRIEPSLATYEKDYNDKIKDITWEEYATWAIANDNWGKNAWRVSHILHTYADYFKEPTLRKFYDDAKVMTKQRKAEIKFSIDNGGFILPDKGRRMTRNDYYTDPDSESSKKFLSLLYEHYPLMKLAANTNATKLPAIVEYLDLMNQKNGW